MVDWNQWSQFDNVELKLLLDQAFPLSDFTLEGIVQGADAVGDSEAIRSIINLSVIEHGNKIRELEPERWCCRLLGPYPTPIDYIDLIEAVATDNLMRRADFLISVQGSPDRAKKHLDTIESVYEGHPRYALYRGKTRKALATSKRAVEKESLLKSAYLDALNATYWSQGQTMIAAEAFRLSGELGRQDYGYSDNPYSADYPYKPFFSTWEQGGNTDRIVANTTSALENSTYQFRQVERLGYFYKNQSVQMSKLLDSIKGRFNGNPKYFTFMAKHLLDLEKPDEAENYYRKGIEASPTHWDNYSKLGIMLFEKGKIEEAYDVFISWPGFSSEATGNRVRRANNAYIAGSWFFWTGHFNYAIPLYRISADLNTGSGGSLSSEIRLNILEGKYDLAAEGMMRRANRYNNSYAYRDYLGILHAFGENNKAWNAFNILVNRQNKPHVWETALTGHHLQSFDENEIASWVQQYKSLISEQGDSYAAVYLLRAGVTDRFPSENLAKSIEAIDQPVWQLQNRWKQIYRESPNGSKQYVLGPLLHEGGVTLPIGATERSEKVRVKSDLVYFAEAYRNIRAENYDLALQILEEAVGFYSTANVRFGYILPYYAYASAKVGDSSGIGKILEEFPSSQHRFDYYLAKGVLAGMNGDYDHSNRFLDLALYRRPHTESRPLFTEYQYAEICEMLLEATENEGYRDRLLDWSSKSEKFFPWYSWAYTMQAKWSEDPATRGRAISIGSYLDKKSDRLKNISVPATQSENKHLNPFLIYMDTNPQRQSL